ncbi:MAG: EF-hand domain-containing protein [bacterium]|nr:EF-hand domain-containing protein [bacterium]
MADAREVELVRKVQGMVAERFDGNYKTAFDQYGRDGLMDEKGLERLLKDAGVGNFATRGTWTAAIMEKLDGDRDGFISFAELQFLQ